MRTCYQGNVYLFCLEEQQELRQLPNGLEAKLDPVGKPCDYSLLSLNVGDHVSIANDGVRPQVTIAQEHYERLLRDDVKSVYIEREDESVLIMKTWR